jgi:hypothetical protein
VYFLVGDYTPAGRELRVKASGSLSRKNLVVDAGEIRELRRRLGTATESEAVRTAVRERLAVEDAVAALLRLRRRGGVEDVFAKAAPPRRRARAR